MSQQIDNTPPSTRETDDPGDPGITIGNWRIDGEGYLRYWPTGHIAFRIDGTGKILIWDKWARDKFGKRRACERPLTMEHLQRFVFQQTHTGEEP